MLFDSFVSDFTCYLILLFQVRASVDAAVAEHPRLREALSPCGLWEAWAQGSRFKAQGVLEQWSKRLKGAYIGEIIEVIKGDGRSLDYRSLEVHLGFRVQGLRLTVQTSVSMICFSGFRA